VKANVGHTTLAAGITSLVKVVLALRNGELPPSPHFAEPNPDADLTGGPLRVLPDRAHWYPGPSGVRTGVVSSFGFSGTNCHLVLQEA
ncbi:hypothetical protein K7G98_40710, partial [Saccharothrix sp. MB29]|nr:hypothetical protein [Saccharothrix sp. MB29]